LLAKWKGIVQAVLSRLWVRVVVGVFLIVLGIIFGPLPGPGSIIFLIGLVFLGFTVDDLVELGRKVIPGFDERKAESILSRPYLRPFRRKRWYSVVDNRSSAKKKGSEESE
jgi:hypothetical protein